MILFLTFQFQEVEKSQLSVDFASWEIFRKTRKKVTKKRFIVLSKKKLFTPRFFPFGFRLASAHFEVRKSIADFSRWPLVDTFMLGAKFDSSQQSRLRFYLSSSLRENVWFNINQQLWESKIKMRSNWERRVWPTHHFIFQIWKCKYQSVKLELELVFS